MTDLYTQHQTELAIQKRLYQSGREDALKPIKAVYDRYRDLDALIMDPSYLIGDSNCSAAYRQTIRALWEAVKAAVEGK